MRCGFHRFLFVSMLLVAWFSFSYNRVFASDVVINEFLANPETGGKEWVEFYNPDGIAISSYWIDDDADFNNDSGNSSKKQLSSIDTSNQTFPYFTLTTSMFNNSCDPTCDSVVLFSPDGSTIVDQYQYAEDQISQKGKSIGRFPDGSQTWTVFESSSKGISNSPNPPPSPTSLPTQTPTPSPTAVPTPTKIPTPTKTPSPTKTPTPTKAPTSSPTSKANSPSENKVIVTSRILSPKDKASGESGNLVANTILGESTESAALTIVPSVDSSEKSENSEAAKSSNIVSNVFMGVGTVFLTICAILLFLKYRKGREADEKENYT